MIQINRNISCVLWIGRINIIQLDTLSKAIYRFNTIPIKNKYVDFYRTKENNAKGICGTIKTPKL